MKATTMRYVHRAVMLVAVLLTAGLLPSPANAQWPFQGKFTLPYKTHWGKAVLPPGDYHLALTVDSLGAEILVIQNVKSRRVVAEPVIVREDSTKGETALLIGAKGGQRIVYSLRIAGLGESLVFDTALAHKSAIENASKTRTIPVTVAKK
jgi:hypothetical protein